MYIIQEKKELRFWISLLRKTLKQKSSVRVGLAPFAKDESHQNVTKRGAAEISLLFYVSVCYEFHVVPGFLYKVQIVFISSLHWLNNRYMSCKYNLNPNLNNELTRTHCLQFLNLDTRPWLTRTRTLLQLLIQLEMKFERCKQSKISRNNSQYLEQRDRKPSS